MNIEINGQLINTAWTARTATAAMARQRRGYLGSGPRDIDTLLGLLKAAVIGLDGAHPLVAVRTCH